MTFCRRTSIGRNSCCFRFESIAAQSGLRWHADFKRAYGWDELTVRETVRNTVQMWLAMINP